MILQPKEYEDLLRSTMSDSWSRLDYEGALLNLRLVGIRKVDAPVRSYFDAKREQVYTGMRYAPLGRTPYKLWAGSCYRVTTQVEFIKPVPDSVYGLVVPVSGLATGGFDILSGPIIPGFKGQIEFTVLAANALEIHELCIVGHLMMLGSYTPVVKPERTQPKGASGGKKKAS